ncbi:hypothetical protein AU512_16655 [Lonsdalea iberica]|uniref:Uncharacterized protein n=1 Tax=Lonsdalea iberica TaxID=1082703 RepID=A0ABX3XDA3_9GAMM|nr:hypothetical protein [Lonsdalea iberica]OSN03392.1 hypothetical protein AU512_16655 [Lonsdalea iberica]
MNFTFAFLVVNYLLLIVGRLYQFDDDSFFYMHYSTMLPLILILSPVCTLFFICRRFVHKWRYAGWNTFLYAFTLLWINYIGPVSAYFSYSAPTIRLAENKLHYVINNPPIGQQALIDLVMNYFKQHPFDKNSDEYSAVFYQESVDSPLSGKRPLAHWWDQSMLTEYQKYQDTVNYELASMTFFNKRKDAYFNGLTRFWLYNDYAHACNGHQPEVNIIDIKSNGTQDPTCD